VTAEAAAAERAEQILQCFESKKSIVLSVIRSGLRAAFVWLRAGGAEAAAAV